jgi:hypothetical protein
VQVSAIALVSAAIAGTACGSRSGEYWRQREAASITTIRGMPVHVLECRGLGKAVVDNGVRRYRDFRCLAGGRAPGETYDTVGVFYVLRALGPYVGPRSRHTLTQVRFIGGPGIP